MKRLGQMAIAVFLALGMANIFAEEIKIGVVDLQKIMQTSSQMKGIQQKLEKEFKPRRDKLLAMEGELKKDMEKFKRESAVMSQMQKKEMERKIVTTQQRLEREGQQYQQELSSAHNEAMEDLYGRIRQAIQKVAEEKKYTLILQKDVAPFNVASLDVTDLVSRYSEN